MEVNGELHTLAVLSPGMAQQYPLNRKMGRPQNQCGSFMEERISQCCQNSTPAHCRLTTLNMLQVSICLWNCTFTMPYG